MSDFLWLQPQHAIIGRVCVHENRGAAVPRPGFPGFEVAHHYPTASRHWHIKNPIMGLLMWDNALNPSSLQESGIPLSNTASAHWLDCGSVRWNLYHDGCQRRRMKRSFPNCECNTGSAACADDIIRAHNNVPILLRDVSPKLAP